MWDVIRDLVTEGVTLLLTTQYLDEADRLADSIAVIDGGRVIAEGTSDELKTRVGGEVLALRVADRSRAPDAAGAVLGLGPGGGNVDNNTGEINVPVGTEGTAILTEAVRRLDDQGIQLADVGLRRPTLDDVFLALTGHAAEEDGEQPTEDGQRSRRRDRKKEKV
jgi:ABC-2 type transport system ATP-binding protein